MKMFPSTNSHSIVLFLVFLYVFHSSAMALPYDISPALKAQRKTFLHQRYQLPRRTQTRKLQNTVTTVLLGDSWTDPFFAADSFPSNYCSGENLDHIDDIIGIGGTTAFQWAAGDCGGDEGSINCDVTQKDFSNVDNVWLSLGGNDFFAGPDQEGGTSDDCSLDENVVKSDVGKVISAILALNPNVKILLTGYGIPSGVDSEACTLEQYLGLGTNLYEELAQELDHTTFVDIFELFGGTLDPPSVSDSQYFVDDIHLNAQGYQRIYDLSTVKGLFCSPSCADPLIANSTLCESGTGFIPSSACTSEVSLWLITISLAVIIYSL